MYTIFLVFCVEVLHTNYATVLVFYRKIYLNKSANNKLYNYIQRHTRNRNSLHVFCCLPTTLTLASGGSPMFPLVVYQSASPSIFACIIIVIVYHIRRRRLLCAQNFVQTSLCFAKFISSNSNGDFPTILLR